MVLGTQSAEAIDATLGAHLIVESQGNVVEEDSCDGGMIILVQCTLAYAVWDATK